MIRVWGLWTPDEGNGGVGEAFVLFVCSGGNGHDIAKTRNSPIMVCLLLVYYVPETICMKSRSTTMIAHRASEWRIRIT